MTNQERVVGLICGVIDELNGTREPDDQIVKSSDTILVGEGSPLDSLGFVTLLASVESGVEMEFGERINLIEVLTSESGPSPRTVSELAAAISALMTTEAAR